jgi:hypothetical protein
MQLLAPGTAKIIVFIWRGCLAYAALHSRDAQIVSVAARIHCLLVPRSYACTGGSVHVPALVIVDCPVNGWNTSGALTLLQAPKRPWRLHTTTLLADATWGSLQVGKLVSMLADM